MKCERFTTTTTPTTTAYSGQIGSGELKNSLRCYFANQMKFQLQSERKSEKLTTSGKNLNLGGYSEYLGLLSSVQLIVIVNMNCMIGEELCVSDQKSLSCKNTSSEKNDKNIQDFFQFNESKDPMFVKSMVWCGQLIVQQICAFTTDKFRNKTLQNLQNISYKI